MHLWSLGSIGQVPRGTSVIHCNVQTAKREPTQDSNPGHMHPLHKWRLNLNNNTHTYVASQSCDTPLS